MPTVALSAFDCSITVPAEVVDLHSFRRWAHSDEFPNRCRISWIDGQLEVDVSPEELHTHNSVRRDLQDGLSNFLRERNLGELRPDGAFYVDERANLANEPDLMFVSWESLRTGRVTYAEIADGSGRAVEVRGAVDIVVEVISRSSVQKDRHSLPPRYILAGVQEYWLIDARGDQLDFVIHHRGDREFVAVPADEAGYRSSSVLDAAFQLTREPNPVGHWQYRLLSSDANPT